MLPKFCTPTQYKGLNPDYTNKGYSVTSNPSLCISLLLSNSLIDLGEAVISIVLYNANNPSAQIIQEIINICKKIRLTCSWIIARLRFRLHARPSVRKDHNRIPLVCFLRPQHKQLIKRFSQRRLMVGFMMAGREKTEKGPKKKGVEK